MRYCRKHSWMIEQHMAEKGPPAPTPKPVRVKPATQIKTIEPPQRTPPKQNPSKATPPLEPRVVLLPLVPADQPKDQVPLYQPNQPNQLPDIPPDQPNQPPNKPPNPPNPPSNPPNPHQIHQISHLTLQQINPIQCSHKTLHFKYHN